MVDIYDRLVDSPSATLTEVSRIQVASATNGPSFREQKYLNYFFLVSGGTFRNITHGLSPPGGDSTGLLVPDWATT